MYFSEEPNLECRMYLQQSIVNIRTFYYRDPNVLSIFKDPYINLWYNIAIIILSPIFVVANFFIDDSNKLHITLYKYYIGVVS
jgi:hypothetical protein